jgi:hypothetical protein
MQAATVKAQSWSTICKASTQALFPPLPLLPASLTLSFATAGGYGQGAKLEHYPQSTQGRTLLQTTKPAAAATAAKPAAATAAAAAAATAATAATARVYDVDAEDVQQQAAAAEEVPTKSAEFYDQVGWGPAIRQGWGLGFGVRHKSKDFGQQGAAAEEVPTKSAKFYEQVTLGAGHPAGFRVGV